MVEKSITGIVTWLKNWFYDSDQVDTFLNSKANKNLGTAGMNVVTDASGEISLEAKPTIPTVPSASSTTPSADTNSGAVGTGTTWARADHKHPKSSIYAEASHDHTVSEITDFPSTMTPSSHTHGNLTNDGKVGSNANYFVTTTTSGAITSKEKIGNITAGGKIGSATNKPLITTTAGLIATGSFGTTANSFCEGNDSRLSDARTPTAHSHSDDDVNVDVDDFINIASLLDIPTSYFTTQDKANYYIDQAFAQVSSIKALEVVSTLPSASASTMGMLYIVNEDSKINFYFTVDRGETYNPRYLWEKMDTDILDELVVNWSDIQNKPSTFTPSSHSHSASEVTDTGTYLNIGNNSSEQSSINDAINTTLGSKGAKTDDIDWTYNSNGFVNGIKLHDKTATGDDATGTISFHLKS